MSEKKLTSVKTKYNSLNSIRWSSGGETKYEIIYLVGSIKPQMIGRGGGGKGVDANSSFYISLPLTSPFICTTEPHVSGIFTLSLGSLCARKIQMSRCQISLQ